MAQNNNTTCPILMNDGRAFTDYRPRSDINKELMTKLGVNEPYSYRITLQNNADKVMNELAMSANYRNVCECSDMTNNPFSVCNK